MQHMFFFRSNSGVLGLLSQNAIRAALRGLFLLGMCAVSAMIGGSLARNMGVSTYTLSYADFISIMLTACSVMLALVTIFLAVLGVMGWSAISNSVKQRTEAFLDDGFKNGNHLHSMVETKVNEIMYQGVNTIDETADDDRESRGDAKDG